MIRQLEIVQVGPGTLVKIRVMASNFSEELPSKAQDVSAIELARLALTLWESFPTGEPRPIVLLDDPVLASQGFKNSAAKQALRYGMVAGESIAEEPLQTIRMFASHRTNESLPKNPLWIENATLMETKFFTDRGPVLLPAWNVEAIDSIGPIWVLEAQTVARCWLRHLAPAGHQQGPHILQSARIHDDDYGLDVEFTGNSEDLFRYESAVVESSAAVSVVPLGRITKSLPPGSAITAQGFRRVISVRLKRPLDGRVLVNHDGSPVQVMGDI